MSILKDKSKANASTRSTGMTQRERRDLSEGRIIAAAMKVIAQRGVSGATLAEIGERAGYSRGLPAHLFGNKDLLLAECMKRMMVDYWTDDFPEIGTIDPFAALVTVIERWTTSLKELPDRPRAHLLLVQEALASDAANLYPEFVPVARQLISGSENRLYAYILTGQDRNEIRRDIDARFEATVIHSTLRGVTQRWLVDPESIDLEDFTRKFVERLRATLLAQPHNSNLQDKQSK